MPPPTYALLASQLLGPASWAPVAATLRTRGHEVIVPAQAPVPPDSAAAALADILAGLPADRPLILVPHSNTGVYAGAISAARDVAACVFVDARIPDPNAPTPLTQQPFRDFLVTKADADGVLPPWTQWWEEDVSALFPDPATMAAVITEQRRLPLTYFADAQPAAPLPARCAYLAFGDTYAGEVATAQRRGWRVWTLPGRHLHQLVDAEAVADVLVAAAESLLSMR
jgi:hypothetical protein